MAASGLLKLYVKWPPPSLFRNAPSLCSAGCFQLKIRRSRFVRAIPQPSLNRDFRNSRHVTAFAKGLHTEAEQQDVGLDQSRGGLPRFHVPSLPATKGMIVRVDGDEFWHMTRVLRLNVNDRIELFDGSGGLVEGTLLKVTKNCAEVSALTGRQTLPQTGPNWHVAAAFGNLKGGRADWLVEKCTELGAQTLTPLLTQRSASVAEQRSDRWHRISMAATKQCQRLHTLDVREPTRLESFLEEVRKAEVAFLAAAGAPPLAQELLRRPPMPQGGLLLIGPEGGKWASSHVQMNPPRKRIIRRTSSGSVEQWDAETPLTDVFSQLIYSSTQNNNRARFLMTRDEISRWLRFCTPILLRIFSMETALSDFSAEEVEMLSEAGAVPVGLGRRRLRVETAAIAILTAVMLLSEDGSFGDSRHS